MQMTYRKAIIILDRLKTTKRIEVDRAELREAVKVAQKALNIVADLPPNHGRLIDADELKKNMRNYYPSIDHLCCSQHAVTKGDIDCAPTIIEAEVSE